MSLEHDVVRFVCHTTYSDLKPEPIGTFKHRIFTVFRAALSTAPGPEGR